MHITGFLHDDEAVIRQFIGQAEVRGIFGHIEPVRSGDRICAVVFFSKDLDDCSDEFAMPGVARALSGILTYDTVIVSAWDGVPYNQPREHVWVVRGRQSRITGNVVPGRVVTDAGEIAAENGEPDEPYRD